MRGLILLLALLAASPALAGGPQLLFLAAERDCYGPAASTGFETDYGGWDSSNTSYLFRDLDTPHSGSYALKYYDASNSPRTLTGRVCTAGGTASFWLKMPAMDGSLTVTVDGADSGLGTMSGVTSYTQKSFTLSPGGHYIAFNFSRVNPSSGSVYVDDIDIPPPAP